VKRQNWKEKTTKATSAKKREASAARLEARLARMQTAIAAGLSVGVLPTTRLNLSGSLREAEKDEATRLCDDPAYQREALRSFRPVPYKYACSSPVASFSRLTQNLLATLSTAQVIFVMSTACALDCGRFVIVRWINISWSSWFGKSTGL
jgi:hypothetical protein